MSSTKVEKHSASFRDPSGFVFKENSKFLRQVNLCYKDDYDLLLSSGLYGELTKKGYLIKHRELSRARLTPPAYKIIEPEQIPFISYPYEWSFSQLKDAALLTLNIQQVALKYGMSLKDASAYNIQFFQGKPVFIDTLSFEKYQEGQPWVAYRQFCQHFLAPLALESLTDLRLGRLLEEYLDGIPLDLTAKLLPWKTRFSLGLASHIFFHARSQQSHADSGAKPAQLKLSQNQFSGIIASLKSTIEGLAFPKQRTTWDSYYDNTNYSGSSFKAKEKIVNGWIKKVDPKSLWDTGANDGHFSRLSSQQEIFTVATDFDPGAIEQAYLRSKAEADSYILPLIIDLTNPSPAVGWQNTERSSFLERSHFDLTLCLALVHHLAIANNLPLGSIAEFYSNHTRRLIIEFVPKEDSNAERLLASREDIFTDYNQLTFEKEFARFFKIKEQFPVKGSKRILYLMEKK
jgi:ribosomal protein L11 methylase PrmA